MQKNLLLLLFIITNSFFTPSGYSADRENSKIKSSFSQNHKPKTEAERFDEDLDRVAISDRNNIRLNNGVYALVQACSPSIELHNARAVMHYIMSKNKFIVNHLNDNNETPLAIVVHGAFNAPVKNVTILLDAIKDLETKYKPFPGNAHALCIAAGTHKYRTTNTAKKNGQDLCSLLIAYGYRVCKDISCKYAQKAPSIWAIWTIEDSDEEKSSKK